MTHPAQDALASLDEYLSQRADAEYRTNGSIKANVEMHLLQDLRTIIAPVIQSASREWKLLDENTPRDGKLFNAFSYGDVPYLCAYTGTRFIRIGEPNAVEVFPTFYDRLPDMLPTPPKQGA